MKIKIYIVTYNNSIDLQNNLDSLFNSDIMNYDYEVYIINNNTNFNISNKYYEKVKILHNVLRPDFSTGHLSRNWNQAIINGFKNLLKPDCDILVHVQDDTLFEKDWCDKLINLHKKYTFIQAGWGDNFCSYTVESVKVIGLWDERFCNIGYQESDYFMRALMFNKEKSSINDYAHGRVLNPIKEKLVNRPTGFDTKIYHKDSLKYHNVSSSIYFHKYGNTNDKFWGKELIDNPPNKFLIDNYIYYPYFEKDVYDLEKKGYREVFIEHPKYEFEVKQVCRYLENIKKLPIKALIWGAGQGGLNFKKIISDYTREIEIVGFLDSYKVGNIDNINIYSPNALNRLDYDVIFLCIGKYNTEIGKTLLDMGLEFNKDFVLA